MSANLYWEPVGSGKSLHAGGSSLVTSLTRAFGEPPWTFEAAHVAKLEGMRDGYGDDDDNNPFSRILDAMLENDGSMHAIKVWPEY